MPTTIPILPSSDFDATVSFYAKLGFQETGRWPGDYLILRHPGDIELHFWLHRRLRPKTNTASCYIRFATAAEAQTLYEGWAAAGLSRDQLRPPEDPGYDLLEFALLDDDRNAIRVGGVIEPGP
jgi:catechol 2,3-dioxygenase-like lactoylglutathione lyase family enzyme